MRSPKDPRHIARLLAVIDLYNHFFSSVPNDFPDLSEFELGNYSKELKSKIYEGVLEKKSEIDAMIYQYSFPVKKEDLDILLLQIIRVCIFEGFVGKITPPKVAIDEAIELTRDFGNEYGTKKVAGILGKIFSSTKEESATQDKVK
jgi:N utilization substance protein B